MGFGFEHADASQHRQREHGAGDTGVIHRGALVVQQVVDHGVGFQRSHRRQRQRPARRIARGIYRRVCSAVKVLVQREPAVVVGDARGIEIQRLQRRLAAAAVDGQIGADDHPAARAFGLHFEPGVGLAYRLDLVAELDIHAQCAGAFEQQPDQIRIEAGQWLLAAVEQGDVHTGTRGDVREFKADVAAADQHQPFGQRLQREEVIAQRQMLETLERQRGRLGTGSNDDVFCRKRSALDQHTVGAAEPRAAMKGLDALFGIGLFAMPGHRISEAALVLLQRGPVDRDAAEHALARHALGAVDHLGGGDQHLLRVAAAQCAGAAERPMVDQRHRPAGLAAIEGGDVGGGAAADDDEVVA